MAQRWQVNTASGPRIIGGKLLGPGEGTFVDDGPMVDPMPRLTASSFAAIAANGKLVDGQLYVVDGLLREAISASNSVVVGVGVITDYTAAQLTTLAAAGGLTPYATYVASDEPPYQQWALDDSTLGSPLGGEYVNVQVAGATGGVVEV